MQRTLKTNRQIDPGVTQLEVSFVMIHKKIFTALKSYSFFR